MKQIASSEKVSRQWVIKVGNRYVKIFREIAIFPTRNSAELYARTSNQHYRFATFERVAVDQTTTVYLEDES